MRIRRHKRRGRLNRAYLLPPIILVLLFLLFGTGLWLEQKGKVQARGNDTAQVGQLKRIEYEGQIYVEKPAITSVLLMGIDRRADAVSYGARQGGQADFLSVIVIDHQEKEIRQLYIDRDTMAEVETLGVLGNPIGTKSMQICLAHSFGVTKEDNCRYAQIAVEKLLEGIEIDYYMSFDLNGIGALNDALGGVVVELKDDYTVLDPEMTAGARLRLNAEQAEIMVRSRMQIGDGTNQLRMQRQQAFVDAAASQLKEKLEQDATYIQTFFDQLSPYMTTNMPQNRILNEANQSYRYDRPPSQTLAGEHVIGEDGFVEYHIHQGEAIRWVIDAFFNPEK